MKKFIFVLVLVCAAGFAGVSLWGSLRAKQAYRDLILSIAESPDARIIDTGYQRGWLQSTSHASVEIRGLAGEAFQQWLHAVGHEDVRGRVGIRMEQTIEHGYWPLRQWLTDGAEGTPVVARVETHLEFDKETQSEVAAVMGRLPSVSISTLIRISGIGESFVVIPAKRLESKPTDEEAAGWTTDFEGLQGHVVYTTDLDHFAASFESAGIEGGDAESVFALRDLKWAADVTRDESGLLVGEVSSSIASFRVASPEEDAPGLELDQSAIRQTNSVEAGRFDSALDFGVREIRLGEQSFGPGEVELRIRDLDAPSLARLQDHGVAGFTPPETRDVMPAAAEAGPRSVVSALLSRSPQLEVQSLRLATPSGEILAKLRIDIDGSRPELLYGLQSLPGLLRIEAEFECPAEIVDALYRGREEELQQLLSEGWVLLDEERYRGRLLFDQGDLLVNGLPRSLDELIETPESPAEFPQVSAAPSGPEAVAPGAELLQ